MRTNEDRIAAFQKKGARCTYCRGKRPIEAITDRLSACCNECAEWDNNARVVKKSLPCICCGRQLETADREEFTVNTVDRHGFHHGMAASISCGYGSVLDCNVYMIALCDDCAKEKQAEGKLIFVYNYMLSGDGSPKQC